MNWSYCWSAVKLVLNTYRMPDWNSYLKQTLVRVHVMWWWCNKTTTCPTNNDLSSCREPLMILVGMKWERERPNAQPCHPVTQPVISVSSGENHDPVGGAPAVDGARPELDASRCVVVLLYYYISTPGGSWKILVRHLPRKLKELSATIKAQC